MYIVHSSSDAQCTCSRSVRCAHTSQTIQLFSLNNISNKIYQSVYCCVCCEWPASCTLHHVCVFTTVFIHIYLSANKYIVYTLAYVNRDGKISPHFATISYMRAESIRWECLEAKTKSRTNKKNVCTVNTYIKDESNISNAYCYRPPGHRYRCTLRWMCSGFFRILCDNIQ